MKKLSRNLLTGAVVGSLIVAGSATSALAAQSTAEARATAINETSEARYGGEELFRGGVFGQGAPAADLEGLAVPVEITPEVEQEIDRIVDQINSSDATYFDRFADLAQSGNVLEVKEAFRQTGVVLDSALVELGYVDGSNAQTVTPQCIQVVLFAVGALVYAGAAILQVAAVAVSVWYAGPKGASARGTSEPTLTHEKWIAAVTTALAS